MKVVGEREILASLVEFKHNLIAETIRKENEEKKPKVKVPVMTKKEKKKTPNFKPRYLRNGYLNGADFITVSVIDLV